MIRQRDYTLRGNNTEVRLVQDIVQPLSLRTVLWARPLFFCFFKDLGFLGKIELRTSGQSVYAVHEAVELRCMKHLEFYL